MCIPPHSFSEHLLFSRSQNLYLSSPVAELPQVVASDITHTVRSHFTMNKAGLVFLMVTQILVLQAMALESKAPLPGLSPLELKAKREVQLSDPKGDKIGGSKGPSSKQEGESKAEAAESPDIRRLGKHHSTDKSVAGGGVIIGGLVTATFAVVYCYIRVTRKRDSGGAGGGGK